MKKYCWILSGLLAAAWAKAAMAFCPVCAVAAGAGVGIAREFGVDDYIVGLWLGGLTVALIGWCLDWMKSKKWHFAYDYFWITLAFYVLTIVPLYFMNILGRPMAIFGSWPIDKIILGTLTGSVLFWSAGEWYQELKKNNHNKAYFPYQKVVMPVGTLLAFSLLFYFLSK